MKITMKMLTLALALNLAVPAFAHAGPGITTTAAAVCDQTAPAAPGFYG
ncbi:MAG: hypothetical protein U1F52_18565 [Burkholderiales bacterium]